MWKATMPHPAEIRLLQNARDQYDLRPLVIHDSYLIIWHPSIRDPRPFDSRLSRRARASHRHQRRLPVMQPGNYKGQELEEGIIAIMYGLIEAASASRAPPCESCSKIRRAPKPPSAAGSKNGGHPATPAIENRL